MARWWPFGRQREAIGDLPRETAAPARSAARAGAAAMHWTSDPERAEDTAQLYQLPPNLEVDERERLNFQHYLLRRTLRGNTVAPFDLRPGRLDGTRSFPDHFYGYEIVDVASGTGIWAREMAARYPSARVIGIDKDIPVDAPRSLIGLADHRGDYHFIQANILDRQGLPFANGGFDFTHMRATLLGIPTAQWPQVLRELIRITRQGGWIELVEGGPILSPGPIASAIQGWVDQLTAPYIDSRQAANIGTFLRDALVAADKTPSTLTSLIYEAPLGEWGSDQQRRAGALMQQDILALTRALASRLIAKGIATADQITNALQHAPNEWAFMRTTIPIYVAYTQVLPTSAASTTSDALDALEALFHQSPAPRRASTPPTTTTRTPIPTAQRA